MSITAQNWRPRSIPNIDNDSDDEIEHPSEKSTEDLNPSPKAQRLDQEY